MVLDKFKQTALLLHRKCFNGYLAHVLCYETMQPNVAVLLSIPEVADSNLNPEIRYPYSCFHVFLQSHHVDSGIVTQIMSWPLSSTSCSVKHVTHPVI